MIYLKNRFYLAVAEWALARVAFRSHCYIDQAISLHGEVLSLQTDNRDICRNTWRDIWKAYSA